VCEQRVTVAHPPGLGDAGLRRRLWSAAGGPCHSAPSGSATSGAPLLEVRALGAQRGVLAVAGVDPGLVRQGAEDPLLDVVDEAGEPLPVLLGVADAAGKGVLTGPEVAVGDDDEATRVRGSRPVVTTGAACQRGPEVGFRDIRRCSRPSGCSRRGKARCQGSPAQTRSGGCKVFLNPGARLASPAPFGCRPGLPVDPARNP
jgi:hypothetical protein